MTDLAAIADFIASAGLPVEGIGRARDAFLDTIGVTLAGSGEPVARIVRDMVTLEGGRGRCTLVGTGDVTDAASAALANGTAAHALDFDDMCFVSLAHPSAPLVAAALAAGELAGASGRTLLEAYVIGFEIEGAIGRVMNPAHYQRGWHCTSTLGSIGAAAAAARILALDRDAIGRSLSIAASSAGGLKENFGTMVKPLHAGFAARNGVVAALLAKGGLTASDRALDGAQGFLAAMASERLDLNAAVTALGVRWEIVETGITVKLYPSCAATHPALDALLDLRKEHGLDAGQVASVAVGVDAVTPGVLIHDQPATGLEAKFSMPYCAASALVFGEVGIDTFEDEAMRHPGVASLMGRVKMHVEPGLRQDAPPLTQSRVVVRLRDGQVLERAADGARGYPDHPADADELNAKFRRCAARALPPEQVDRALGCIRSMETVADIRMLSSLLRTPAGEPLPPA